MAGSEGRFDRKITVKWDEIEPLRQQADAFLQESGLEQDTRDAITMVLCELTENAIKYGDPKSDALIGASVELKAPRIIVEVKNPVGDSTDADLKRLDEMVQFIRGFQDPFQAYLARMEEISQQSLASDESGLGLVRIAYEGESFLDFYVDDSSTLAVSAVYEIQPTERT